MNHEDRSQRRRWGALTVLSAAAGAAMAAATIPAAPAFASPADDAAAAAAAVTDLAKAPPTELTKMDTAITTYFDDLTPTQRLAEDALFGIPGGSTDPGALAEAQEQTTIVDIFGNTTSQGAQSFEGAITSYYDTLIKLLGDGGGGIYADAAAIKKEPELTLMNQAITDYFDDLSPAQRAELSDIGTAGGGSDAGAQAVAQEDALIDDIFGANNTGTPGAVMFEQGIQNYYDSLIDLLGNGGGNGTTFGDAAAAAAPDLIKAPTELAKMDTAITTYFDDLTPAQRLAEDALFGIPTGSTDPGALAFAQEETTIVDIFGNTTSQGAQSFEAAITGYYDELTDLLDGNNKMFTDAAASIGGGGSTGLGLLDTDLHELGLSTALVGDVNDVIGGLSPTVSNDLVTGIDGFLSQILTVF
jgi:hypothetical protein